MSKTFSKDELNEVIETINHWWHRHGDEDLQRVEKYIKQLYKALPPAKREATKSEKEKAKLTVSKDWLEKEISECLEGYSEEEITQEVEEFWSEFTEHLNADKKLDAVTTLQSVVVGSFEDFFMPASFADPYAQRLTDLINKLETSKGVL